MTDEQRKSESKETLQYLTNRWAEYIEAQAGLGPMDINALVQHVLREAYLQANEDLQFHAEKVRYFNKLKKKIREETRKARQSMLSLTDPSDCTKPHVLTEPYIPKCFANSMMLDEDCQPVIRPCEGEPIKTREKLEEYIDELEETLQTVGDDSQLANVDMQNMLQKQQQALQMISNISKQLHDTAMAVIRKIG